MTKTHITIPGATTSRLRATDRELPFGVAVTSRLDDVAALLVTPNRITLHLREGSVPDEIIPWGLAHLNASVFTAFCTPWGITVPKTVFEKDPWRYAQPVLGLTVTRQVIPAGQLVTSLIG